MDNKSAIAIAEEKGKVHKQKHINIKYHYTRELICDGVVKVCYCHTKLAAMIPQYETYIKKQNHAVILVPYLFAGIQENVFQSACD